MREDLFHKLFYFFDGVEEKDMNHLPTVSSYNNNYYEYKGRLLYAKSDDDNFTQWYLVRGNHFPIPFAGSYCEDNDSLIVDKAYT